MQISFIGLKPMWHAKQFLARHPHYRVKVAQSCVTLCNPKDYTVHEIL